MLSDNIEADNKLPNAPITGAKVNGNLFRRAATALRRMKRAVLVRIGWRAKPVAHRVEVMTRAFLPLDYVNDQQIAELPGNYSGHFMNGPVSDCRLLIGREEELEAVRQARELWEAKRPVSLIVVGEEGSGKTSLIDCAVKTSLKHLPAIHLQLDGRIETEEALLNFLAGSLQVESDHLSNFLNEQRRVAVLENVERAFLRRAGSLDAVRALQQLMAATRQSTFWILSINEASFKFLDAAVDFAASFSHRINSTSAKRDELRDAILLRHHASGLKLHVLPGKPESGLRKRNSDLEAIFFDALAKQSAGVFRSAFDIWLDQIDRIDSGILYVRPLIAPDLSPVIKALSLDDLFSLVALMQHGSLTRAEHASVFQQSLSASQSQLDGLLGREVIEAGPNDVSFRVRPEARRFVRAALFRRNLV